MSTVLYEPKGAVVRITLNRPQAMNAFDLPTARELGRRLEEFDKDDALRVAIVTGAGDKAFCAGADLKQMHGGSHAGGIDELWGSEIQYRLGQRLQVTKPVIAAINGYCLAGGLELALGCDIRIASETASFGCPEVRWSILHGFGAMRLPSHRADVGGDGDAPHRRAHRRGARAGDRAGEPAWCARAALLATAEQMAERISQNGPLAIKLTKELAWRSLHQHPDDALRFYGAVTALIHETEDSKEGPRAFAEKRTPRFKGK